MRIFRFQEKIFSFYDKKKRDLPWRKTTDPYKILLSEVMLQQTPVDRVIKYYTFWIKRWPTAQSLAKASRTTVLKEWLGLGYNNRALRLHEAVRLINDKHQGNILKALAAEKLPGIGSYTKNAVLIFSKNEDIITVDTNIRRILLHEFHLSESTSKEEIEKLAKKCLPRGKSRLWHNALMDFGATFLTSKRTGIRPLTRQKNFEGSFRQLRAKLLRLILSKKSITLHDIQKNITDKRIKNALFRLEKDKLIVKKRNTYSISD